MQKIALVTLVTSSILLSGCMPTVITGATVSAAEFAKDRPAADTVKDMRIAAAIKASFAKNNFRELYTKISVEVVQGRVLYTGTVDNDNDAVSAVAIAWDQEGVTEVLNELKVDKKSGQFNIVQYTRDSLITSQIKSKIFADRSIKFVNYTVITVNDVVYLFGIARSEEELQKVANIASNINGVDRVVSHARVDELAGKIKPSNNTKENKEDDSNSLLIDEEDGDIVESKQNSW